MGKIKFGLFNECKKQQTKTLTTMNLRDRILQTSKIQQIISESDTQYKKLTEVLFNFFSENPTERYTLTFEFSQQRRGMYSTVYPALDMEALKNLLHYTEGLCVGDTGAKLEIYLGKLPTLKPSVPEEQEARPAKRTLR